MNIPKSPESPKIRKIPIKIHIRLDGTQVQIPNMPEFLKNSNHAQHFWNFEMVCLVLEFLEDFLNFVVLLLAVIVILTVENKTTNKNT